jgi:hypothetical protein
MRKIIAVVSDLHVGSSIGLCSSKLDLADGGTYQPSKFQAELYRGWQKFFQHVAGLPANKKALVVNGDLVDGDLVDGDHHGTVSIVTNNIEVQEDAAIQLLRPAAKGFDQVYVVRGTEAHTQPGAQSDERIAKGIGAALDESTGQYSRWQLWLDVDGVVFNVAHHIGTTSSAAYESSAVMREMVAALVEAGQWEQRLPDVLIRSHRHRYIKVAIPSARGEIQTAVTPGWQLRTPFVEKMDRMRMPHIGGMICIVEDGICHIEAKIYPLKKIQPVKI